LIDPNISEREKACIRILATLFQEGTGLLPDPSGVLQSKGMKLEPKEYVSLMRMMEGYEVISDPEHTSAGLFWRFRITSKSVRLAREVSKLDEIAQEPWDIVSQANEAIRKHPFTAWIVILVLSMTVLLAFVNQVIQFLKNVGMMK
jgi:hypothetical protein